MSTQLVEKKKKSAVTRVISTVEESEEPGEVTKPLERIESFTIYGEVEIPNCEEKDLDYQETRVKMATDVSTHSILSRKYDPKTKTITIKFVLEEAISEDFLIWSRGLVGNIGFVLAAKAKLLRVIREELQKPVENYSPLPNEAIAFS